jgi:hypothetical protein
MLFPQTKIRKSLGWRRIDLKRFFGFAFPGRLPGLAQPSAVSREAASRTSQSFRPNNNDRRPDAALRKKFRVTQLGNTVNLCRVTAYAQKRHFHFITNDIRSSGKIAEVSPMTQRASESLVAVLIRIGLLLALAIMLMAENAQAQPAPHRSWTGPSTSLQLLVGAAGSGING